MSRSTAALSRWVHTPHRSHRPHRRSWLADTRDQDWSTARLLDGARPGRGA
jgi:hypothetical protein